MLATVQSVLISTQYSIKDAKDWIINHGFKIKKIDITEHFYRFRQENPDKFKRFRIKKIAPGIEFVLGF
jgi:hypothetical protein